MSRKENIIETDPHFVDIWLYAEPRVGKIIMKIGFSIFRDNRMADKCLVNEYKRSLRKCCQLMMSMLHRRRFRPEIATKTIDFLLRKGEQMGMNLRQNRKELHQAEVWINNPPHTNCKMSCDVIGKTTVSRWRILTIKVVFRLIRSLPKTTWSKRYLIDNLRMFEESKSKKWRCLPTIENISMWPCEREKEHISVLIQRFDS